MDAIDIVCATSSSFAPAAGVMITSVLINTCKDCHVNVNIVISSISNEDIVKFRALENKFDCTIQFIQFPFENILEELESHEDMADFFKFWSGFSLMRLFDAELFKSLDKVIHLDCDIICNKSLAPLYELNIDDYLFAAVPDIGVSTGCVKVPCDNDIYYNAGMTLLNLKKMRKEKFTENAISLLKNKNRKLRFGDQDVLNILGENKIFALDYKWNFLWSVFWKKVFKKMSLELKRNVLSPFKKDEIVIYHYIGTTKPWDAWFGFNTLPMFLKIWLKYKRKSPWKDSVLWNRQSFKELLKNHIRCGLWYLNIHSTWGLCCLTWPEIRCALRQIKT